MNKKSVKERVFLMSIYRFIQIFGIYFRFSIYSFLRDIFLYIKDFFRYKNNNGNFSFGYLYPCLKDKTKNTPLEPVYFFQDTWAAKKIFEIKPKKHVDIGSNAKTVGIISQFVPTTMVDIRPLPLKLQNLNFIKGSILKLPFEDDSIECISSLCVIEHIGLGRYGDDIDSFGSEKSVGELKRVVKENGYILFSVPVYKENKIFFNANRAFKRDYILKLFEGCELVEEKYIYGNTMHNEYREESGIGCFLFKKLN